MTTSRDPLAFWTGVAGAALLVVWAALMLIFSPPAWASWTTGVAGGALAGGWAWRERAALRRLVLSPHLRTGSNAVAFTAAVVAAIALLNVITTRHSWRGDLTANKFYSLSDQTTKILKGLSRDVKVTAFVKMASPEARQIDDLLKEYRHAGRKLAVELVDVDQKPAKTMLYKINAYNTVVIESGSKRKDIASHELFGYQFQGQQPQREFKGEPVITSAILSVASDHQPVVYFLEGHGELSTADASETGASELKTALERDNYVVRTANLLKGTGKVPADADVLILAGPRRGLPDQERKALAAWLAGKGRMLVMLSEAAAPGLDTLLGGWGVKVVPGLVAEGDPQHYYSFGGPLVPIPEYKPHRITDDLRKQGVGVMMPFARALTTGDVAGGAVTPLLETTGQSWAETEPGEGAPKYTSGKDKKGPLTVGAAVTVTAGPAPSSTADAEPPPPPQPAPKLVVFGGAAWLRNDIRGSSEANGDLFANAVSWLAGGDASISIRPKPKDDRRILLDQVKVRLMWWVTVILTPLGVLAYGALRWYRRRSL